MTDLVEFIHSFIHSKKPASLRSSGPSAPESAQQQGPLDIIQRFTGAFDHHHQGPNPSRFLDYTAQNDDQTISWYVLDIIMKCISL